MADQRSWFRRASIIGSSLTPADLGGKIPGLRIAVGLRLARASALRRIAIVIACLTPIVAGAEPLVFDGTLTLDFFDPTFDSPTFTGTNVAIAASGGSPAALGTLRLRGGLTSSLTVLVTDPETIANQVFGAQLTAGIGIATLAPFQPANPLGPQLTQRTLPIPGLVRLCLLNTSCNVNIPIPLTEGNGARGLGVGGVITVSALNGFANISIEAAPWTLGTASLPVATTQGQTVTAFAFGFAHGPSSFTATTASAGGVVNLVAPMATTGTGAPNLSGFNRLRIRFVPEPDLLVSLASCLIALLVLGRIRTSR